MALSLFISDFYRIADKSAVTEPVIIKSAVTQPPFMQPFFIQSHFTQSLFTKLPFTQSHFKKLLFTSSFVTTSIVTRSFFANSVKTTCNSMFRDERGILEPQADIFSTALAVIGFVVFAAIMSHAYLGYEARSFALDNYESASLLAETLESSPALKAESSNLISASSLDKLSEPSGVKEREKLFASFSGNYLFLVEVQTLDGKWHWTIVPDNFESDFFIEGREKIAASMPVVIELNPAESVPGTLTVVLYKTLWR